MNILLIGLRCSGKTTIGGLLARRLGLEFVDLDEVTAKVLGARDVRDAWNRFGQEAFRRAETVALSRTLVKDDRVVALGGGTPTAPMAEDLIRSEQNSRRARVVYLAASGAVLRERLERSDLSTRPGITGGDAIAEVDAVLAARDPLYRMLADRTVDVGTESPESITAEVARHLP